MKILLELSSRLPSWYVSTYFINLLIFDLDFFSVSLVVL